MRKHRWGRFGFGGATVLLVWAGCEVACYTHPLLTKKRH